MADYIDRGKYCEKICRCNKNYCGKTSCSIWIAKAEDVAPVVHGRWGMHSDRPDTLICSICDHAFDAWKHDIDRMHYCPNCGAKMDGGKEDQNAWLHRPRKTL